MGEPMRIKIKRSLSLLALCLLVNACRTSSTRVTGDMPLSRPMDTDTNVVVELQTNTIVVDNQTRSVVRLSRNRVSWMHQVHGKTGQTYSFQWEASPGQVLVIGDCFSNIHEEVSLKFTGIQRQQMGCVIGETRTIWSKSMTLELGINDPARVITLRSSNYNNRHR